MSSGQRFAAVRAHLGLTQVEMSEKIGVTRTSWGLYEKGQLPNGSTLEKLSELGFSIDWLLAGRGQMMQSPYGGFAETPVPYVAPVVDPKIFRTIVTALNRVFRDLNQKVDPAQLAERAAEIYPSVAGIADEAERRGAITYAANLVRTELLQAASGEVTSKRLA